MIGEMWHGHGFDLGRFGLSRFGPGSFRPNLLSRFGLILLHPLIYFMRDVYVIGKGPSVPFPQCLL